MATKINKANADVVTDATLLEFIGLANLEQQAAYTFALLVARQNAYNASSPPSQIVRFAQAPTFNASTVTFQASLNLSDSAISGTLITGVQSAGIAATKIAKAGGDTSTDATLNEFLALDSLEKQLVWLAVRLAVAENTYNTANPTATFNRVTITPNFDANTLAISVTLGMSSDASLKAVYKAVQAYL